MISPFKGLPKAFPFVFYWFLSILSFNLPFNVSVTFSDHSTSQEHHRRLVQRPLGRNGLQRPRPQTGLGPASADLQSSAPEVRTQVQPRTSRGRRFAGREVAFRWPPTRFALSLQRAQHGRVFKGEVIFMLSHVHQNNSDFGGLLQFSLIKPLLNFPVSLESMLHSCTIKAL